MSNLMKIAIPLIDNSISLEDIQKDSGFVDAFFEDINKPALTNHIFLMYESITDAKNIGTTLYKLYHLPCKYSNRIGYIKGTPYNIYTFTINKTIKNLRDGNIILSPEQKQRVLEFWGFKDAWITNNVLLGTMYDNPTPSVLPEEDFLPEFTLNDKGETLE